MLGTTKSYLLMIVCIVHMLSSRDEILSLRSKVCGLQVPCLIPCTFHQAAKSGVLLQTGIHSLVLVQEIKDVLEGSLRTIRWY